MATTLPVTSPPQTVPLPVFRRSADSLEETPSQRSRRSTTCPSQSGWSRHCSHSLPVGPRLGHNTRREEGWERWALVGFPSPCSLCKKTLWRRGRRTPATRLCYLSTQMTCHRQWVCPRHFRIQSYVRTAKGMFPSIFTVKSCIKYK